MVKSAPFELIAGSYEEFLLGYAFSPKEHELVQSFAAHDHTASIRCLAVSGHYLASGGADDRIFIYDFKSRKEHCSLTHHNATVNCLQFTENHSHLISGSADGVLAIVRVGNWQLEKIWEQAHKGAAILDIAVHSSGKLALTLGADASLCTWNLVKGREAYTVNLNSKCKDPRRIEKILWAPDGTRFVLYGGQYTEIWSIECGGPLQQTQHAERVTSCAWKNDSTLLVGHEDGQITILNTEDQVMKLIRAHENRVKAMTLFEKQLISVSSSGEIKVWNKKLEEIGKIDTGCRLTCLCAIPQIKVKEEDVSEVIEETPKQRTSRVSRAQVVEIVENSEEEIIESNTPKLNKTKRKQNSHKGDSKKKKNTPSKI